MRNYVMVGIELTPERRTTLEEVYKSMNREDDWYEDFNVAGESPQLIGQFLAETDECMILSQSVMSFQKLAELISGNKIQQLLNYLSLSYDDLRLIWGADD